MQDSFRNRFLEMMNIFELTQQQVSDRANISKSLVSRYCSGELSPKINKINKIAEAFGVDPMWLAGYETAMFKASIESAMPYNLEKLKQATEILNEKEREKAYNVLKAVFPEKIK